MAMPGWQLPGSGLVIAETPSGSGLMGAHAYSCDRGMGIPQQLAHLESANSFILTARKLLF